MDKAVKASEPWVRAQDAPLLPPPPNLVGVRGWILKNLFSTPLSGALSVLLGAFLLYEIWSILDWAVIRAVWVGEDREACIKPLADGARPGACWAFVGAKFHQFIYGFYPFEERWRVNICFVVAVLALVPMLIPSIPYKRENALFLLLVYPLMTLILLTGGHFDITANEFRDTLALLLFAAVFLPLIQLGIEEGVAHSRLSLGLACLSLLFWVASFIVDSSPIRVGVLQFSTLGLAAFLLVGAAALLSIRATLAGADRGGRNLVLAWLGIGIALLLLLVLLGADLGLAPVETSKWGGLLVTLVVAVTGIAASLPLGILLALGRRSRMPVVRLASVIFIEVWRGVPLITVLFMASVMLPLFLPAGMNFDKLLRVLIGTALFSSAYMAEVVRGGLQAIPKGQYEAARALGLSYWKMMSFIVLPQALKIVIPGIVNSFISLLKDTTLVLIVGLFDLLGIVQAGFADQKWVSPETAKSGYFIAALMFWCMCFGMSRYSIFMERRLATGHRR